MAESLIPEAAWVCMTDRLRLSTRERQIARAILKDKKQSAIAELLCISPHTVHTHLERLYHKLGVTSRLQLVVRLAEEAIECVTTRSGSSNTACPYRIDDRCPLTSKTSLS